MHIQTLTLFNYRESENKWYTTVFTGVNLIEANASGASDHGTTGADTVDLIIHVRPDRTTTTLIYEPNSIADAQGNVLLADDGIRIAYNDPDTHEDRNYVKPKAFNAAETVENIFTFQPEKDFFCIGNYSSSEPIDDDDFDEGLYHAMNAAHDDVYMVTSVQYFSLLPHFEIGGK